MAYYNSGTGRSKDAIRSKDFATKAYFNLLWEQVYNDLKRSLKTISYSAEHNDGGDEESVEMTRMIFEDRSSETQVRYIQLFPSDVEPSSVMRGPGNHSQVDAMASIVRYRFQSFPEGYIFLYCRPPHPKKKFNMCVKRGGEGEEEGGGSDRARQLISKREKFVFTPKNIENPGCGTRSIELFNGIDVNIPIYPRSSSSSSMEEEDSFVSDSYFNLKIADCVPYNRKHKNTTGIIYVTGIEMINHS